MQNSKRNFRQDVETLLAQIPEGRVMTYGDIAVLCGRPRAARIVGGIAHYGEVSLPWHRVVRKDGGLASGYPGGMAAQRNHLAAEGINVSEDFVVRRMSEVVWRPS